MVRSGGHHTYFGLNALINKIFNSVNEQFTDKEVWISRLTIWLKAVSDCTDWGEYYIYPIYTANKVIRGWQVRFPSTLKLPKSNKAMMCSTCGGQEKALFLALQYRNYIFLYCTNTA